MTKNLARVPQIGIAVSPMLQAEEALERSMRAAAKLIDDFERPLGYARKAIDQARAIVTSPGFSQLQDMAAATADLATKPIVAKHIAVLLSAFSAGRVANPEGYGTCLVNDVAAQDPTIAGLELACRTIRRTATYKPTIGEVLKALTVAEADLRLLRSRVARLAQETADAAGRLAKWDANMAREQREREEGIGLMRQKIEAGEEPDPENRYELGWLLEAKMQIQAETQARADAARRRKAPDV